MLDDNEYSSDSSDEDYKPCGTFNALLVFKIRSGAITHNSKKNLNHD